MSAREDQAVLWADTSERLPLFFFVVQLAALLADALRAFLIEAVLVREDPDPATPVAESGAQLVAAFDELVQARDGFDALLRDAQTPDGASASPLPPPAVDAITKARILLFCFGESFDALLASAGADAAAMDQASRALRLRTAYVRGAGYCREVVCREPASNLVAAKWEIAVMTKSRWADFQPTQEELNRLVRPDVAAQFAALAAKLEPLEAAWQPIFARAAEMRKIALPVEANPLRLPGIFGDA